jgi:hypothetical protein
MQFLKERAVGRQTCPNAATAPTCSPRVRDTLEHFDRSIALHITETKFLIGSTRTADSDDLRPQFAATMSMRVAIEILRS